MASAVTAREGTCEDVVTREQPAGLVVIGGGEHARVVMEAVRSRPDCFALLGFSDPQAREDTVARLGVRRLGDDAAVLATHREQARFIVGVGNIEPSDVRRRIVEICRPAHARFASVVHISAMVSQTAVVEEGATILAGAVVNTGARIGAHAIVNTGAIIEHDADLGAFVNVGPGAVLGGAVRVGDGAYIGLGACVRDHVIIGAGATVGMGAVVVKDVPSNSVVIGVPARLRGSSGMAGGTP
jgi:UDP-perosamine 4-acetyltransferase